MAASRLALLWLVVAFSIAARECAAAQVVFAQVVHRHGARTPTSIHGDHKWACGSLGCGILTTEGKDMLFQLGLFARERYMLLPGSNATQTAYIANSSFYFPKQIVQRSTDVSRTLQSAAAFLQGFYDRDPSSFYPCVNTVPLDTDSQLYVASIPAFQLHLDVDGKAIDDAFETQVLLPAINESEWAALGEEFRIKACRKKGSEAGDPLAAATKKKKHANGLVECFEEVYDVAESYYSMGILGQFPLVQSYYETLRQLKFEYHAKLLVWNPAEHTDGKRGPLGRNLMDAILAEIGKYVSGSKLDAEFMEFSVEDSMICALTDTLGQPGFQLPPFGDAWFFELLEGSNDPSNYTLRILHGSPTQQPGDHRYTFQPFNLTCQNAAGTVYWNADGACPLADFQTWYATQIGTSSEGYCYLRPDVRSALQCDTIGATAPNAQCAWYRRMCPEYACPAGSYLSYPLLNCVAL